ncbi:spore germination protein [Proteiniborus sp. MB09-C3]|uniref:spore germination protein n=1 Tax=Proteiniborus sp. MB09-C3 TaxID=3050072 RepID=UPI002557C6B0|nr:spore germination protein [Proteiniborus sp. MB09-C3]WIV12273.1 spore germination protein [Proteiniborus sp. MB09-C3]
MGFLDRFFKKQQEEKNTVKKKMPSSKNLEENMKKLKEVFKDCDDVLFRNFKVGAEQIHEFAVIQIDGIADKDFVNQHVLRPLMLEGRGKAPEDVRDGLFRLSMDGAIATTELKEIDNLTEAIDSILVGDTAVIINGYEKIIIIGSRGYPTRGINEAESETVVRGPRDGFVETLKFNTGLIRKRIRDTKFKVKNMQAGERSKTDIAVLYIEDIANPNLVKEIIKRIESIKIDAVLESSYVEQLIEDSHYSPFPQLESTEKPDAVAAALYQGRIAIVVDNTPFCLLAPATVMTFLQAAEDYYQRWPIISLSRLVRYFAVFVSLLGPALYIAVVSYHPGLLPTRLALYIGASRINVPFPAFIEAFMMEITIELLREAGSRMSGPIGTTISIVGGLVIGQAAVEAGIVSPLMVIVVAVTAIASFMIPNFGFASSFRILRFIVMAFASVLGLYGIMLALIMIITHLVKLTSFEIPYMAPFATLGRTISDLKDTFIKVPLIKMRERQKLSNLIDEDRLIYKEHKDNGDDKNDRRK